MTVDITYDKDLINEIAARFDLRDPNKRALESVVKALANSVQDSTEFPELVTDLATGVGKTYLMSSLVDYVAAQGVRHVLIVTPGSVIQNKTLANFDAASAKYVGGADHEPVVITPDNFQAGVVGAALRDPAELKVFVFNVQQLIRPTDKVSRKVRDTDENLGNDLYSYLVHADDLLVIADEHHIYHEKAKAFSGAIRDLQPVGLVGLTATPSKADLDKVIFQYTLGEAIADGHVKTPVIVYRKDGTKDERTQLADACRLLSVKEDAYEAYRAANPEAPAVRPVLFVVASNIEHAGEVGQLLAQSGYIGDPSAVLEITSQSSDEALTALSEVEAETSSIRAIVSVNMLREGWDVKNIAVIVALRRLASQTLTEQILGRGLRLPFGARTGSLPVDQVDLVAHDSYQELLAQKDVLRQRIQSPLTAVEVDAQGAATTAGGLHVPDPTEPTTAFATSPAEQGNGNEAQPDFDDQVTFRVAGAREHLEEKDPGLFLVEAESRIAEPRPLLQGRMVGAPQITFPRREARLEHASFSLSDIADGDAEAAGTRFITEVPTFLVRDALVASREGEDVMIKVTPQAHAEAQQAFTGIDTIRDDLTAAIFQHPGVMHERAEKNAARRLVKAFLKGAGVAAQTETAEWGETRRQQAVAGMASLIKEAYAGRKTQLKYELVPITLPVEPVLVDSNARDAYNDSFANHLQFVGWQRNIMPVASFDARTTEWALAHLLDRDPAIVWWLRVYTNGPAYIPTTDGSYFPDFIALGADGTYWLIEGKSDKNANDADVLRKRGAAEQWARSVRDDGQFGTWRYVFATETHIREAAGSWAGLLVTSNPE